MSEGPIPWQNVLVRYCPRCRLTYPYGTEQCGRCGGKLVDKVRREKLEEK
jgi:hypothetical protein